MKRGDPARPDAKPWREGDVDVAQLKQLVEIQTQIVKLARKNQIAKRNRAGVREKLAASPNRVLRFIARLW